MDPRDARCHARSAVQNVDAQCDNLATVVDRMLTTPAMIDVHWGNFSESRVWDKVPDVFILEMKFLYNTLWDKSKEASVPANS